MAWNASTPTRRNSPAVLFRLSLGVLLALAAGIVAGYYHTQQTDAAPVSLAVVEGDATVRTLVAQSALSALPLVEADQVNPDTRLEDSLALLRSELVDHAPSAAPVEEVTPSPSLSRQAAVPVIALEPATPVIDPARSYNHRPLRKSRTLRMLVTAYSPDERSCGKWADGITASGYSVWTNGMKLVAADTRMLPFGSILTVPGYNRGRPVPVLDRGGKIKGHRLDLLMPTHEAALKWGKRWLEVQVWEYAD